jgi:hypothetical protein
VQWRYSCFGASWRLATRCLVLLLSFNGFFVSQQNVRATERKITALCDSSYCGVSAETTALPARVTRHFFAPPPTDGRNRQEDYAVIF